jgi:hypothetical protein
VPEFKSVSDSARIPQHNQNSLSRERAGEHGIILRVIDSRARVDVGVTTLTNPLYSAMNSTGVQLDAPKAANRGRRLRVGKRLSGFLLKRVNFPLLGCRFVRLLRAVWARGKTVLYRLGGVLWATPNHARKERKEVTLASAM